MKPLLRISATPRAPARPPSVTTTGREPEIGDEVAGRQSPTEPDQERHDRCQHGVPTRWRQLTEDDSGQDRDRANREINIAGHEQHGAGDSDDADDGDLQQHDVEVGHSQVAVAARGEEGDDEDEGEEKPVALRPANDAAQALRGHATGGLSDR